MSLTEKSVDEKAVLEGVQSHGVGTVRRASIVDDVFGEITEGEGPNYRNVGSCDNLLLEIRS